MDRESRYVRVLLPLLGLPLVVSTLACQSFTQWGSERTAAMGECADVKGYRRILVQDADVTSEEKTEEALADNAKFARYARDKIVEALSSRFSGSDGAAARFQVGAAGSGTSGGALLVKTKIRILYGSRTARYLVGFGAGKGEVDLAMQLVDPRSRDEKLTVHGSARLGIGVFGGSMENTIEGVIDEATETLVESVARSVESAGG
jgi:hypothetical protein